MNVNVIRKECSIHYVEKRRVLFEIASEIYPLVKQDPQDAQIVRRRRAEIYEGFALSTDPSNRSTEEEQRIKDNKNSSRVNEGLGPVLRHRIVC